MHLTFKYRIKDKRAAKYLAEHARAVNAVWNFCCEVQREAEARRRAGRPVYWPSAFDLMKLTAGSSVLLGTHSNAIKETCRRFATVRDMHKRRPRFRASRGAKRALGWIPHQGLSTVQLNDDTVTFLKRKLRFWKSREIEGEIKGGAFVEDSLGRWFITFQCKVQPVVGHAGDGAIGIDLGLQALATGSDGMKITAPRFFDRHKAALATAQRASNKRRARAISVKIANCRRHHLHEWSTKIVRANKFIVVGDVSASRLKRTKMAKSVSDAGWAAFKNQLRYKASRHGVEFLEVDERFTSRACSRCGVIADSSPKGMGSLGVRSWTCNECGAAHDRDVNAARNILRIGLERQPPAVGIAA